MKLAPGAHAATAAARERFKAAWQALYAAEGSDWFWWYSHRNRSDQDAIFDRLFRDDLAAVYEILGDVAPGWLDRPIGQAPVEAGGHAAAGYIAPPLTAAPYPGDEWSLAAALQPAGASSGTMQRADIPIERLFLGHDQRSLYLRLDLRDRIADYTVAIYLSCAGCATANQRTRAHTPEANPGGLVLGWEIELQSGQSVPFLFRAAGHDQWQGIGPLAAAVGAQVLEVAVPMAELDLAVGRDVSVLVTLAQHGDLKAALPERGMADFTLREFGQK